MIKDEYVVGLDVSTKTIGICVMDLNGKLIHLTSFSPDKASKSKKISLFQKARLFENFIKLTINYPIKHVFVEEPLKNGPNIDTTIMLAKFNGIISMKMFDLFGIEPEYVTVHEARSIFFPELIKTNLKTGKETLSFPKDADKKKMVLDKVSWLEPHFIWDMSKFLNLKPENFDKADAYVVCKSGLRLAGYNISIPKYKNTI